MVYLHDKLLRYINLLVGVILTSAVKTINVLSKKPLSFKADVMFPTASSKADTIPNSKNKNSHNMTEQVREDSVRSGHPSSLTFMCGLVLCITLRPSKQLWSRWHVSSPYHTFPRQV